jgi:hypothetical protein
MDTLFPALLWDSAQNTCQLENDENANESMVRNVGLPNEIYGHYEAS